MEEKVIRILNRFGIPAALVILVAFGLFGYKAYLDIRLTRLQIRELEDKKT